MIPLNTINLTGHSFNSMGLGQRGIGDLLEDLVKATYSSLLTESDLYQCIQPSTVRSIEDFSIAGEGHVYYDVKTRDLDRNFSMPNLISAKRLYRLYQQKNVELRYALVEYRGVDANKEVVSYTEMSIESIDWSCLSIQNLGEGQIQLNGTGSPAIFQGTRAEWMEQLKQRMQVFLDHTIIKMERRKLFWEKC
jgi:hypothetical protein